GLQKALLLPLGAERDDDGRDHLRRLPAVIHGIGVVQLFHEDVLAKRTPAGAAMLHRPMRCAPAAFIQNALPSADVVTRRRMHADTPAAGNVGRRVLFEELPDFLTKVFVVLTKFEMHGFAPELFPADSPPI